MELTMKRRNETNKILSLDLFPLFYYFSSVHQFPPFFWLVFSSPHYFTSLIFLTGLQKAWISFDWHFKRPSTAKLVPDQVYPSGRNQLCKRINTIYSYVRSRHVGGNMNGALLSALTLSCVCMRGGGMNGRFFKVMECNGRNGFDGLFGGHVCWFVCFDWHAESVFALFFSFHRYFFFLSFLFSRHPFLYLLSFIAPPLSLLCFPPLKPPGLHPLTFRLSFPFS